MLKKILVVSALTLATVSGAYAKDKCADTMKTVEQALTVETIPAEVKKKADDLLAKAKEKQAAGDNKTCVTLLSEAAKVLTSE